MRALQLIDHLGSGGAQQIVLDLARLLPEHGIEVDVAHLYAPNRLAREFADAGSNVHDLSTGGGYSPAAALDPRPARALRKLVRARAYDVVNVHLYIAPLHLAVARRRLEPRAAIVNTVHAHRAELPGYVFPSYRLTAGTTRRFVGDFACNVDELRGVGVPAERATFVPFGVDPVDPAPAERADALREELGIPLDAKVALSVARLHSQRYLDRFIRAHAAARSAGADVHLVLAGDGPELASLRRLATDTGVPDSVHTPGRRSDLDALFAVADVYLSASRNGDVGIAALQAASAGVACIAWDTAGATRAPEELDDSSFLPTAGDEPALAALLRRVLGDDELREALAANGRRLVRTEHDARRMAARYADIYREVVTPRP